MNTCENILAPHHCSFVSAEDWRDVPGVEIDPVWSCGSPYSINGEYLQKSSHRLLGAEYGYR